MAIEWSKVSDEVLSLAYDIIREYHPKLLEFNIGFVFRSEAGTSAGRRIIGQAAKAPAKLSPFMDLDGIIWLAEDVWLNLDSAQKKALVDHELTHFQVGSDGSLSLRGHDVEEFYDIILRYGLWRSELQIAAQAFQIAQQKLPGFERNGKVVALNPEAMGNGKLPGLDEVEEVAEEMAKAAIG